MYHKHPFYNQNTIEVMQKNLDYGWAWYQGNKQKLEQEQKQLTHINALQEAWKVRVWGGKRNSTAASFKIV